VGTQAGRSMGSGSLEGEGEEERAGIVAADHAILLLPGDSTQVPVAARFPGKMCCRGPAIVRHVNPPAETWLQPCTENIR